ncbi:GCN5-related N-acetyltransferase (plasmid) [Gemmatirosa kalamazoonensis]|uniref:GCN5-related N-acetyltransferase n=1 Tax=Gemmatirosa kalamazoonensis TaxID=861299 RepID=W0RR53_9BACT|nr:GNAT family N-acetyltransferase [Gemmatirosa kalamazoonensis]AHG92785.1 GCN5-related N-acetyltransferase [Gemmatirosa kalamazoonensis]
MRIETVSTDDTDSVVVRDVTAADAAAVAALLTELGHPTDEAPLPARLDALRAEGGAAWLALDAAGEPLGLMTIAAHAVLHAAGPVALITALVVTRAARGRGVGRRLVDDAKRWAAARGCVRLTVTSGEQRADAHAFYPACGLAYTGRRFTTPI